MTDLRRKNPALPVVPDQPGEEPSAFVPFITGDDLPDELIERMCKALCPPVLATVDMPAFVRLIGASHSLSAVEKLRVFNALPTLSQFQIDELIKVMSDEVTEFSKLVNTEWHVIASLTAKSWLHLCMVADHLEAGYPDDATERKALTRMLKRKYSGEERKQWVGRALGQGPLADHVFSAFAGPTRRARSSAVRSQLPEVF